MSRNAALGAVVAMLRSRMGGVKGTSSLALDCDPGEVVAVASAHFVLPALHAAAISDGARLPRELAEFLAAVAETNRARNTTLRRALWQIAGALNAAGVSPLALKGGAFLADPAAGNTDWRFMSDLDLLVDEPRLEACVRAVEALGFTPVREEYEPEHEAHYPPLLSPCGTFSIELHTRLFALHEIATPVASLLGEALTLDDNRRARLLLLAPRHRIAHLIAHAQIHNRFHAMRRVVLRDMLDLGALLAAHGEEVSWPEVIAAFPGSRDCDAALSLLAAWSQLAGVPSPVEIATRHRRWAVASVGRLSRPLWQRRLLAAVDRLRTEVLRLTHERGHVRRRLALLDLRHLARVQAMRRHKLAQRLWA